MGTKYEATFIIWEGDAWNRKMHPECAEADRSMDYDEILYEGQFKRGTPEYA